MRVNFSKWTFERVAFCNSCCYHSFRKLALTTILPSSLRVDCHFLRFVFCVVFDASALSFRKLSQAMASGAGAPVAPGSDAEIIDLEKGSCSISVGEHACRVFMRSAVYFQYEKQWIRSEWCFLVALRLLQGLQGWHSGVQCCLMLLYTQNCEFFAFHRGFNRFA